MITLNQFIARLESMKEIDGVTGDTPVTVAINNSTYEMFETAAAEVEHVHEVDSIFVKDIQGQKNTKPIIKIY